ncbi:MAG TPA: hypothetical protein VMT16_00040 [Thermoanaerobaculia bacterium]|nr:hypothetical protein [Thermoanaerobaculia bacterium]
MSLHDIHDRPRHPTPPARRSEPAGELPPYLFGDRDEAVTAYDELWFERRPMRP